MPKQYVTTAIDFPNAAPHMGHVMEKILADVFVRWYRLRGDDVRFHIGTDENGIKIQQTAKAQGMTPKQLVDQNAPIFEDLFRRLHISFDYFIRTSDQQKHWPTVVELWRRLHRAGSLEKRTYTGLYCVGCERFVTSKDLVDGLCIDHKIPPVEVTEENWFFLLRRTQKDLQRLLDPNNGSYRMVPAFRGHETLSFLDAGLEDVSFSRSTATLQWGVPVPDDPDQVMYVWCDNLTSYISSLDYFNPDSPLKHYWDDGEVTHVIGKDIARFHALNWPAMLQEAGVRTPDRLLIHGFLTSEGQKMSKSIGNVVVPDDVISKYGIDPLRFYLSHEIPVGNDGDFSWKRFQDLYDSKLRNQVGNLLNRVLVLLGKQGGELTAAVPDPALLTSSWKMYAQAMGNVEFSVALGIAMDLADRGNKFIDVEKPWARAEPQQSQVLSQLAELLRHLGLMLLPFMPETAQRISQQLNVPYAQQMVERSFTLGDKIEWGSQNAWKKVGKPEILFAPIE